MSHQNHIANQRGALTVPLLLSLLAVAAMGFGTWGVMRRWRHLTETQLRLGRCVGDVALELKGSLERIESANGRMRKLRLSNVGLSALLPPAAAALKAALALEAALQDAERFHWETRRARWLVQRGCGNGRKLALPLPSMDWSRLPDDALGSQPLKWTGASKKLRIQLYESPRAAAAIVEGEPNSLTGELISEYSWKAAWARPGAGTSALARHFRPSTY